MEPIVEKVREEEFYNLEISKYNKAQMRIIKENNGNNRIMIDNFEINDGNYRFIKQGIKMFESRMTDEMKAKLSVS